MKLLPHHKKILEVLNEAHGYGDERYYFCFASIAGRGDIKSVPKIRRIVRHLARRGLAEYGKGLFTEDGELAGSGYRITAKGTAALNYEAKA